MPLRWRPNSAQACPKLNWPMAFITMRSNAITKVRKLTMRPCAGRFLTVRWLRASGWSCSPAGTLGRKPCALAQAIELDPQNVFLLTDAALGDLARRDAAAAQKHLARARDLNPKNTTVLSFLASSFQLSGDIARAQTFLDDLQPAQGDAILVSAIEGNAVFLRKYDSAIAMMKTQLEKPGELGTSLGSFENWFGDLQRHAGDAAAAAKAYQAAKHFYEEGLRAQPDNADFLNALA